MKQTSSALTFLMAQYRAIFKRAYVKGIAAAVLLTAGLAAGASQVQAADLTTNWKDGSAITTQGSGDTFKRTEQSTASSLTVGVGHSLETSGGIFVNSDADIRGDLTISSGAIQLIEKEGDKKDKDVYRHAFNATGADLNLSGNIGAASFNISDGSLVLKSGGPGNTNLTAYGEGWVQGEGEVDGIDYDRTTANGLLSNMDITVNSGTNIAALYRLTIDNDSKITLSGGGSVDGVESGDTAYLEGSRHLDISDSTITVSGYANGIFSPDGHITDTEITINATGDKLLIAGNANDYTTVLSGGDAKLAEYVLTGTEITNKGILQLGTTAADSFTITGGTIKNTGTVDFEGGTLNLDSALVAGLFASGDPDAKGTLNLVNGAKVTVTGDDLADLSAVGIADASGSGIHLVASGASTWTQDKVKLGKIFNSANLAFDVKNLTAETAPYNNVASGDNAFVIEQGEISVSNSVTLNQGTLTGADADHRIYVIADDEDTFATLNLVNDGSFTGHLNNVDRVYIGYKAASHTASGTSVLKVDGNWDFGGARVTANTSGTANLSGTITNVGEIALNNAGIIKIGTGADVTATRLMGSETDVTTAKINIDGKLTFIGDNTADQKEPNGGYTNDIMLTKTSIDINNGGTLAITTEDALDDFLTVGSGSDGNTTITVATAVSDKKNSEVDQVGWDNTKVDLKAGGTLQLNLDTLLGENAIGTEELGKLKKALVKDVNAGGSFNFGDIDIILDSKLESQISGGEVKYEDLANAGINNVQGVDMTGVTVTVDSSSASKGINLSNGAASVELASGVQNVNVKGSLVLTSTDDGNFVYTAPATEGGEAKVAGVTVQADSAVNLTGAGTVGSLTSNGTGTSAILTAGEGATQKVEGNINLETVSIGTGTVNVAKSVNANNLSVTGNLTTTALTTEKAEIQGAVAVEGNIDATKADGSGSYVQGAAAQVSAKALKADTATLAGTTTVETIDAKTATFNGGSHTIAKSLDVAEALVVTNNATLGSAATDAEGNELSSTLTIDAAQGLTVDGGATIVAQELSTSGAVYVGSDTTAEDGSTNAGAGTLSVNTLSLNDQDLIVDPAIGGKFSFAGADTFGTKQTDAGVLDGNVYALMNSIAAFGESDRAAVEQLFAQYINPENGSLGQVGDKVAAIAYVAQQLNVKDGKKIVVDPSVTLGADRKFDTTGYTDAWIGENGVLAISVDAASTEEAAVQFAAQKATITADAKGKVVITGDYNISDSLKLFADAGTNGSDTDVTIAGSNGLRVETLNGLLANTFTGSIGTINVDDLKVTDKVKTAYTDTSSAVRNSLIAYATGDTQWANTKDHNIAETRIHGAYVADVMYEGGKYYERTEDGKRGAEITDQKILDGLTFVEVKVNVPDNQAGQGTNRAVVTRYDVYEKAGNDFLTAIREQTETRGAAADAAAHMAEFGGVAQVALKAGSTTTDAIAGRMGMGAQNSAITFANNGQGAGIWVTPIYVSSDSDGFEAQGVDYGTDINLYGVALGGDYTLANGVRIGAMFNVGSGDADGQGAGSSVTSDFDYYGFGLYAGYSVGQFSVVGDVPYTAVDNDVEANTGIDKLETSLDSANLSVGVTGSYAFETAAGVTVTPHVGLRYSNIDIDDYSVKGKTYGTVGDYSADSLSVFSIPVGVTIASEFQAGTWSVKPSFDVTLTGNFGDDEAEGTFHWAGVENIDSSLNSEIFDNFTYGASLGIAAQSSSGISLGVAVGYTGSSNVDDFGVNANARFTF